MVYSLKKIQMVIITLMITVIGNVQGSNNVSSSDACCNEPCAPEVCCSTCCGQFFVGGSLLCLRAFEGGLSSACDGSQITDVTSGGLTISTLEGKGNDPDFKWNAAFRVGVGYQFANCNSDIGLYWTHYNSHTHRGDDNDGDSDDNEQR